MFIKINKDFINIVKQDMKNNINKEIGYIFKPNNTYEKIKGKKRMVEFPYKNLLGIEMHTHPLNNHIDKYDPPSNIDYFTSWKYYKSNDAVVFDKNGLYIYKANNFLLKMNQNELIKNNLIDTLSDLIDYYNNLLQNNQIDIKTYILRINKLGYVAKFNNFIGFKVKYYPYIEIKNQIIKLRYKK